MVMGLGKMTTMGDDDDSRDLFHQTVSAKYTCFFGVNPQIKTHFDHSAKS